MGLIFQDLIERRHIGVLLAGRQAVVRCGSVCSGTRGLRLASRPEVVALRRSRSWVVIEWRESSACVCLNVDRVEDVAVDVEAYLCR